MEVKGNLRARERKWKENLREDKENFRKIKGKEIWEREREKKWREKEMKRRETGRGREKWKISEA